MSDARLKKGSERTGQSRQLRERAVTANRGLTDAERLDAYRRSFFQDRLPNLPAIDGHHVCWLSKNNPSDPIYSRIRMGYKLIGADELPGWEHAVQSAGDYPGAITVNEMVAAKIPLELYDDYMRISHHEQPLEQAGAIVAKTAQAAQQMRSMKSRVDVEEGTRQMAEDPGSPDFTRMYGEGTEGPYRPREIELSRQLGSSDDFVEARDVSQ
jgi:hypothetical protein